MPLVSLGVGRLARGALIPQRCLNGHLLRRRCFSSPSPPPGGKTPSQRPKFERMLKVSPKKQDGTAAAHDQQSMISRFLGPKPMPERHTAAWYGEMLLICTVFAITGSSTMLLVRPAVKNMLGIQGTFRDGPWSYRICSLVIMSPIYAVLLVGVGTVFGRHFYFKRFSIKIISRFGIPPESLDPHWYRNEKYFRKW